MQKRIEQYSGIRAYLKFRARPDGLIDSLKFEQDEMLRLHGSKLPIIETFAKKWRDAGHDGLLRQEQPLENGKETIPHERPITSIQDFINYGISDEPIEDEKPDDKTPEVKPQADKNAVLLGALAMSLYGMRRTGEFSLYDFTVGFNSAVYGTKLPSLEPVSFNHPSYTLTGEEKGALERSFQKDPTGAHAIQNPMLWPRELRNIVMRPQLEEMRDGLEHQIPIFKWFAQRRILSKDDHATELDAEHPEKQLSPGVASDILSTLKDF